MLSRIASLLLFASATQSAQVIPPTPVPPEKPPLSALTIPGMSMSTPPEISIQIASASLNQVLIVQARDKDGKDTAQNFNVEVQVSPLLGKTDRRWVNTTAKWVHCAKEDRVCNKTSFDWQERKQLRLTVGYLPLVQPYEGTLDLIYDSKRHPFKLIVERKQEDPPELRMNAFTTEKAEFEVVTVLRAKKDALYSVRIEATPLTSKSVPAFTPLLELDGKGPHSFNLPPFSQIPLKIKAKLPVPDTYTGGIDLFYNGQRVPLALSITRTDTAVPLKYRLSGIARDGVDFGYLFSGASSVAVRFDLEGLRSDPITLNLPRMAGLARKDSEKVMSQATFDKATVQEFDGKEWNSISQGPTLPGRTAKEFRIVIDGLTPGEYSGTLSVANDYMNAVESPVGITVRRSWFVAVLLIMIGVLGSLWLRRYAQQDKPKLVAQRDIAKVNEDLQTMQDGLTDVTPEEQEVFAFLGKQLNKLYESWEKGVVATGDAQLKEIAAKLALVPRWVNLRRRLESTTLPSDKLLARRIAIAGIKDAFQTADSGTTATKISAVDQDITKDLALVITDRIASLTNEVVRQEQSGAGKVLKQKLDEEVMGRLKQATDLAASPERLQEAAFKIGEANLVMVRLLATGLEAKIPPTPPDQGIDPADWQAAVADIRQELAQARSTNDPDTASAAYKKGYAIYLTTLLQGIRIRLNMADERIAALTETTANTDKEIKSHDAREMAENCDVLLNAGDTAGAQLEFETLDTAVRTLESTLRDAEAMEKAAKTGTPPPERESLLEPGIPVITGSTLEGSLVRETVVFPGTPIRMIRPASELDAQIKVGEWKVAIIGFIIAVVVGLRMLWLASPTWGDLNDMTIAILWGLGVHQTAALFLGQFDFATLIMRITGTKAPT